MRKIKKVEKKKDMTTGKRKRAIARAKAVPGKGVVTINSRPLHTFTNQIARMRIQEPLLLAGKVGQEYDFTVTVRGGGVMGQSEAVRQAISRSLVRVKPELKESFLKYDRFLLVYDPRRTEPHKPPHSSWGPRRAKQKSKR